MSASPLPVLPLPAGHLRVLLHGDQAALTPTQADALAAALLTPGTPEVTYTNLAWHTTLTLSPTPEGAQLSTYKGQQVTLTPDQARALSAALRAAATGQPAPGRVHDQLTTYIDHTGGVTTGAALLSTYPHVTYTADTPAGPRRVTPALLAPLRVRTAHRQGRVDLLLELPTATCTLTARSSWAS